MLVVDSHVHVCSPHITYRQDVQGLIDSTSSTLGKPAQLLEESDYLKATQSMPAGARVVAAVFVEVLPATESSIAEVSDRANCP